MAEAEVTVIATEAVTHVVVSVPGPQGPGGGVGTPVEDSLTSDSASASLAARRGKELKELIDDLTEDLIALDPAGAPSVSQFNSRAEFITALGVPATGTALAAVLAARYDGVTFRRAVAAGLEAEIPMRVVTGDPGADALKVQLGSTGKWLTQRRHDNVIFLAKYGTWTEGADVTDNVIAAYNDNPNGGIAIWPMGNFQIRYKNLFLGSGWVHEPMFFGKTTLSGITGGATQSAAYANSIFSIPTDARFAAIRGLRFAGASDAYFAVHARNGARDIVVQDCDCTQIGLWTTFYYAHAIFLYASSTDSNRVKGVLIERCSGTNTTNSWGFIDVRYVDGMAIRDCVATGYSSGVIMWGGDSAIGAGKDGARTNERKVKNVLVEHCRFVGVAGAARGGAGASYGGVWASMAYNCHVVACYTENWDDIGYDWEGCDNCSTSHSTVKDCFNMNFGHFWLNDNITFFDVTSIITDPEQNCHYRSFNATLSPTGNSRIRIAACFFLSQNGIGLSYCNGGPVANLVIENCEGLDSRFDLDYSESNYQGRVIFRENQLRFSITAPAEMNGTVTSASAGALSDSTKLWQINMFRGCSVTIVSGTGAGQTREIRPISGGEVNTATRLQIGPNWTVTPDATSSYRIDFAAVVLGGGRYGGTNSYLPDGTICERNQIIGVSGNTHYSRAIVVINKADTSMSALVESNRISRFASAVHITSIATNGGRTTRAFCFRNMLSQMHSAASAAATVTSGSPTVTVATAGLKPRMLVTGTGIPAGTIIAEVNGDGTITLSANATASGTPTLTFAYNRWTAENSSGGSGASAFFIWQDNYEHTGSDTTGGIDTERSPRIQASVDLPSVASLAETTIDIPFPNLRGGSKVEVRSQALQQAGFYLWADVIAHGSARVYARNLTGAAIDPSAQTITVYPNGLAA